MSDRVRTKRPKPEDNGEADEVPFDVGDLQPEAGQLGASAGDLFDDVASLALSQDFAAAAGVKKKIDVIKVEKPSKSRVFRAHPDPAYCLKTLLLVLKDDNEVYLVAPRMRQALARESTCGPHALIACVSKGGAPFIWPVCMADADGKWNVWHESAWMIASHARQRWCRMQADRDAGNYVAEYDQRPEEDQQAPEWPDLPFNEWLRLAFRNAVIDSPEHPVLRRLRLED
jgi:hypothetical protein